LNKGDGKPMPLLKDLGKEYRWGTAPEVPAPAFNVQRVTPIAAKTADTNTTWQDALKVQGSVWQFYQLVMTQWPVPGNAPNNQGTNNFTTPPSGPPLPTAWANTTMETFDQSDPKRSCMACHNSARTNDFVWGLSMRAGAPPPPPAAKGAKPAAALKGPRPLRLKSLERLREAVGNR
jgi:hypothetical protein